MNIEELKQEVSQLPPEQRQEKLEELISQLPPEELSKLKQQECIFCQIASKKIKSYVIYEDDEFLAVLDVMPANLGHIILFPKQHINSLEGLNDKIFTIAKQLAVAIKKITGNVNILLQSGVLAGQKTEHLIIHIIPRTQDDKININWQALKISEQDLEPLKEKIIQNLPVKEEIIEEKKEDLEKELPEERLP